MNIRDYKDSLIKFDLKSFLESYTEKDIFRIRKLYPELYTILAEQLKLYTKAGEKLPVFTQNYCYFTTKSYEQSSSQRLAEYKAGLFSGNVLLDLTGGLGADDWAFSKSFNKVISVERDPELNVLSRINFQKLNTRNIERVDTKAEDFLEKDVRADLIYVDADRRKEKNRSITIEGSDPDVLKILKRMFELSENILLKLSPLTDISYITKALQNIKQITVISAENDVKEILVHLNRTYSGRINVTAADLSKESEKKFSSIVGNNSIPKVSLSGSFFYEPSGSLIKSGLVNSYAESMELNKISKNGNYLLGKSLYKDFFGRAFKIIFNGQFSKTAFLKYLKGLNIQKANISQRDFPVTAAEIKKRSRLGDGGEDYFFFTSDDKRRKWFFHCRK